MSFAEQSLSVTCPSLSFVSSSSAAAAAAGGAAGPHRIPGEGRGNSLLLTEIMLSNNAVRTFPAKYARTTACCSCTSWSFLGKVAEVVVIVVVVLEVVVQVVVAVAVEVVLPCTSLDCTLPLLLPSIIELKVVATAGLTSEDGNHDDDHKDDDDDDDDEEETVECRPLLTLANVSAKPGVIPAQP